MNLETKITIYKFTPQVFTLTLTTLGSVWKLSLILILTRLFQSFSSLNQSDKLSSISSFIIIQPLFS